MPLSSSFHFLLLAVYGIMKIKHKFSSHSQFPFNSYTHTCCSTLCSRSQWKLWISRSNRRWLNNHGVCSSLYILGYSKPVPFKPVRVPAGLQTESGTSKVSHRQMNSKCHCHSILCYFLLTEITRERWRTHHYP